jgi:hypothetical protein
MGILMGGAIRASATHAGLVFANACVTGTLHCYSTDGSGLWNNLSDNGAYAYQGVNVTCSAGGFLSKNVNMNNVAYYPDLGINGLFEVVELDADPNPPTCFTGETTVLMADGSLRRIDEIAFGDLVIGRGGSVDRVVAVEQPFLGGRTLYALNGGDPFVTAEHPFLTSQGWKSINPAATAEENPALVVDRLETGHMLHRVTSVPKPSSRGGILTEVELEVVEIPLVSLIGVPADPQTRLYNLVLDGAHTYIADGYLVHNKGGSTY